MIVEEKLDEILLILKRIEERQIRVREEIKEQVTPVVGSFASSEPSS
jgi:hypothetical protein